MLKELLINDTKAWAGYVKLAKIEPSLEQLRTRSLRGA